MKDGWAAFTCHRSGKNTHPLCLPPSTVGRLRGINIFEPGGFGRDASHLPPRHTCMDSGGWHGWPIPPSLHRRPPPPFARIPIFTGPQLAESSLIFLADKHRLAFFASCFPFSLFIQQQVVFPHPAFWVCPSFPCTGKPDIVTGSSVHCLAACLDVPALPAGCVCE